MQAALSKIGLIRPLEISEEIYASHGVFVGYSVRAVGVLDTRALATAYSVLRERHPALAARIVPLGSGRRGLAEGDASADAGFSVVEDDPRQPLAGFAGSQSTQTSAVHVVRDVDDASVVLLTHHSIADGHHSLALLAQLWAIYTAVANGDEVALDRHPYPESTEKFLLDRGVTIDVPAPEPVGALAAGALPTFEDAGAPLGGAFARNEAPFGQKYIRAQLSGQQTAWLIGFCRQQKLTVNGLVSAALILAEAKVRSEPIASITYRYAVDLRNRVVPPVGLLDATNMLSLAFYQAKQDAQADIVSIGRAIKSELDTVVAAGSIQRVPLFAAALAAVLPSAAAAMLSKGPLALSASNWGVIPDLASPVALALVDFHPAVYLESRASSGLSPYSFEDQVGDVFITTYQRRLNIDFPVFPDGHAVVRSRADATKELLVGLR